MFSDFFFRVKGNKNNSKGKEQAVTKDIDDEDDDVGDGDNDWMKNGSPYNAATGMCKSH